MRYEYARAVQDAECERVLDWRAHSEAEGSAAPPHAGVILTVEHDPVITVSKRPGAEAHVLASPELLLRHGVRVVPTDRGGDVTYHGPGQLVVYPIIDLNRLGLRIHGYMRCLEQAVIDTLATFGIPAQRDPDATGVWVEASTRGGHAPELAKICAMGVRVRRWVTLHGLAINVDTELAHFDLINPCGLDRPVTSMHTQLDADAPVMDEVRRVLVDRLLAVLGGAHERQPDQ